MIDDGLPTPTSAEQAELERRVLEIYGKDYVVGETLGLGRLLEPPPRIFRIAAAAHAATAARVVSSLFS